MKAPPRRRQRTVNIGGEKIKIVITRRTNNANHAGWTVRMTGFEYHCNVLSSEEAFAYGIAKFREWYQETYERGVQ